MKILQRLAAFLAVLSMILILLVTATEAAIYIDFGFYEREYEKYGIVDELHMEMDDIMDVTQKMMMYLHGDKANLVVHTMVDGVEREFFNEREKAHMVDVRNLFSAAIHLRYAAIVLCIITVIMLVFMNANWKKLLSGFYMIEMTILILISGGLGYLFTQDFNKYFIKFHEIFFDNDLWLLNPNTDLMIRMLPEEFFSDFTVRIGIFGGITILVFLIISYCVYKLEKKKIS